MIQDLLEELDVEFKARINLKHVNYFLLQYDFDLGLPEEIETKVKEGEQNP